MAARFLEWCLTAGGILTAPPRFDYHLSFDFLELFAGEAGISRVLADMGFVVGPPIELKRGWDLMDAKLRDVEAR